jgi:hypothetical protein
LTLLEYYLLQNDLFFLFLLKQGKMISSVADLGDFCPDPTDWNITEAFPDIALQKVCIPTFTTRVFA